MEQSPAAEVDDLLRMMMECLHSIERFQGSVVKLRVAEANLLQLVDRIRDIMNCWKQRDRTMLLEVFGGDCCRLARARVVCETVKLSAANVEDHRLKMCIHACESVEGVIENLGMNETLMKAQMEQRLALGGKGDRISDGTDLIVNLLSQAALEKHRDFISFIFCGDEQRRPFTHAVANATTDNAAVM